MYKRSIINARTGIAKKTCHWNNLQKQQRYKVLVGRQWYRAGIWCEPYILYFTCTVYISYYEALIPVANIKPTLKVAGVPSKSPRTCEGCHLLCRCVAWIPEQNATLIREPTYVEYEDSPAWDLPPFCPLMEPPSFLRGYLGNGRHHHVTQLKPCVMRLSFLQRHFQVALPSLRLCSSLFLWQWIYLYQALSLVLAAHSKHLWCPPVHLAQAINTRFAERLSRTKCFLFLAPN